MILTDDCLKDLDAPLRSEEFPQLPQNLVEINTEVTIPLLKHAIETIKRCCDMHCKECEACPIARNIRLGDHTVTICRCANLPQQWDITHA